MSAPFVIAVPAKGRLQENAARFFSRAGLELIKPRGARDYRGTIAGLTGVEVAFLSASEITELLGQGMVHFGVTGEDLVREMILDADSKVILIDGLGFSKVVEMNWGETLSANGLQVEAFRPMHWGRRSPFEDDERGYNSYLITKNGKTVLFAGDTGYSRVFEEMGRGREIVMAFFPVTAYKPDWFQHNHATPEDALKMFVESGAKFMVPIHWGTFILSHEPLEEPLERLKAEAKRLGIEDRVVILKHGESFTVPE